MKRILFSFFAACLLLVTACGDATTEKASHGTSDRGDEGSTPTGGAGSNEGLDDTLSTNATLPGSAAPSSTTTGQ
jgi:hypothetical protein